MNPSFLSKAEIESINMTRNHHYFVITENSFYPCNIGLYQENTKKYYAK